ncbi:Galanin receptor type 2 [Holothuria leucospilota]|uniref:Galanin receptor type 2 n=1 Tax=Holothuria leucospilota TaxID=206669 RepID=A0A9Q0YK79_HOLLE|nr:Galanin receptor type 2 [Holothuria leucospilota]
MENATVVSTTFPTTVTPTTKETYAPDVILAICYLIIGILGITGNGIVIIVFLSNRKVFRSITNLLILNQAIMDFVVSIIFLLDRFGPSLYTLVLNVTVAELFCRLWDSEYLLWAFYIASTQNLVMVSLERYFATCHPVIHRNYFTIRGARLGIIGIWLFGLIYQSYWIFVHSFNFESQLCFPSWSNATLQAFMGTFIFSMEYLIPLLVMTFSYVNIILMLKKRGQGKSGSVFQRAKRNVTITLCLVFISYVICWTPTEFGYLFFNWGRPYDFEGTFHFSATVLVLCNMCTAPFIYTFKYEQFQNHLKRMFLGRCLGVNRIDVNTVSAGAEPRDQTLNPSSELNKQTATTA